MISTSLLEEKLHLNGYGEDEIASMLPKLEEIDRLKQEKNAILLAHYYQIAPIQIIADVKGDSLALALAARNLVKDKRMIVSSTVHFMAEMVKLLNPNKKVVIPDMSASCSIAEGMNGATVRKIRDHFPNSGIVAYINTTAEVKAEVDSVCTSANAEAILRAIPGNPVIMLPDHYFAKNVFADMKTRGIDNRDYLSYRGIENGKIALEEMNGTVIPLDTRKENNPSRDTGVCIVHEAFTPSDILLHKEQGVDLILAHPEVKPEIGRYANMVGGTKKMIDYLKDKPRAKNVLFITECDMAAPLREAYPEKNFVTPCRFCPYMKKNNLDNVIFSLREEEYEINIDPLIANRAKKSLDRMFELMGGKI